MKELKLFLVWSVLLLFSTKMIFCQQYSDEIKSAAILKKAKLFWKISDSYTVFSQRNINDTATAVLYPVQLNGWQKDASVKSGGNGLVGFFKDGYVQTVNSLLHTSSSLTVAIRLRNESGRWNCGVFSIEDTKGHPLVDFNVQDTGQGAELIAELNIKDQNAPVRLGTSLKKVRENIWHSFILTFDGLSAVLYVNGEQAATVKAKGTIDVEGIVYNIGKSRHKSGSFTGMVDYAAFWDSLLSNDDIRQLSIKSHAEELAMAQESVDILRDKVANDPYHPIFHLAPPSRLMNDPNGPIFFNGKYHLFYQFSAYYPGEYMAPGWGHAASKDMVHWKHMPIALMPIPGTYDAALVASGNCVINNEGIPTILYTSATPQTQSLAMSADGMITWTRFQGNPVIRQRPDVENIDEGFRDPFLWKEKEYWYMTLGSGIKKTGGTVLLYRSRDLYEWEFLNQLAVGMGKECFQWECPNFFKLGDKHVLIVSPLFKNKPGLRGDVQYAVGEFDGRRFKKESDWKKIDHGGPGKYYAPNSLIDAQGRRIMWGVLPIFEDEWAGLFSLPRLLHLDKHNVLNMEPLPELSKLRGKHWSFNQITLQEGTVFIPGEARGRSLEINVKFDPKINGKTGVDVFCSNDFNEKTRIAFDGKAHVLKVGDTELPFRLRKDENGLNLHIFIDRSVIEVFVNNRECITNFVKPSVKSEGIRLFNEKDLIAINSLDIWEMGAVVK